MAVADVLEHLEHGDQRQEEDQQQEARDSLEALNATEDLRDMDGNPAARIRWDRSCLQKKCGACAMVIDYVPRLACDTRLTELKQDVVRIEPLRKFAVVADLLVDRSVLMDNLAQAGA